MTVEFSNCSRRRLAVGVLLFAMISIRCSAENTHDVGPDRMNELSDAGRAVPVDSGIDVVPPQSGAGGFPADAGGSQIDSGVLPADAGDSQFDAGSHQTDTGGSQADTGELNPDDGGPDWQTDASLAECAKVSQEAEQIEIVTEVTYNVTVSEPVAMYLMLDKSGSMSGEKWEQAKYAINKFVGTTLSENINLALQYFPLPSGDQPCTGDEYSIPAVPLGRLPDNANAITRSMADNGPDGGTPMEGGLRGLTQFCTEYKLDPVRNPDGEDCVGVLITDGYPGPCSSDVTLLSDIAGDAFSGPAAIQTFTIGMTDADFTFLDAIAQASGSDCDLDGPGYACDISGGSSQDLLEALETIRDSVTETRVEERVEIQTETLECEWQIPEPPEHEAFDRGEVNMTYSDSVHEELIIGMVTSEHECADRLGWYYDNPDDPQTIVACDKTCDLIEGAVGAKIDIVLGCQTILIVDLE